MNGLGKGTTPRRTYGFTRMYQGAALHNVALQVTHNEFGTSRPTKGARCPNQKEV